MKHISTRSAALRAGSQAGRLAGIVSRTTKDRMSRDRARKLAADHPVSARWRPVFERAFIKNAILFAHTDHGVSPAKYGVA